jgi:hypothetical protein
MANYNEVVSQGTMWTRCYEITVSNPFAGLQKTAKFFEEDVVVLDQKIIPNRRGFLQKVFNPSDVVELRDPQTNQVTGETVTHEQIYSILYSLYMASAIERDEQQA